MSKRRAAPALTHRFRTSRRTFWLLLAGGVVVVAVLVRAALWAEGGWVFWAASAVVLLLTAAFMVVTSRAWHTAEVYSRPDGTRYLRLVRMFRDEIVDFDAEELRLSSVTVADPLSSGFAGSMLVVRCRRESVVFHGDGRRKAASLAAFARRLARVTGLTLQRDDQRFSGFKFLSAPDGGRLTTHVGAAQARGSWVGVAGVMVATMLISAVLPLVVIAALGPKNSHSRAETAAEIEAVIVANRELVQRRVEVGETSGFAEVERIRHWDCPRDLAWLWGPGDEVRTLATATAPVSDRWATNALLERIGRESSIGWTLTDAPVRVSFRGDDVQVSVEARCLPGAEQPPAEEAVAEHALWLADVLTSAVP